MQSQKAKTEYDVGHETGGRVHSTYWRYDLETITPGCAPKYPLVILTTNTYAIIYNPLSVTVAYPDSNPFISLRPQILHH